MLGMGRDACMRSWRSMELIDGGRRRRGSRMTPKRWFCRGAVARSEDGFF